MRYRRFGKTDLTVSELGFGCARMGGVFQGASRQEQLSLLRAAFDAGITFYDTADMYAQGESERLLGDAFHADRHRIVIASKVGYRFPARSGLITRIKPLLRPLLSRAGLKRERLPSNLLTTVSAQDFTAAYITHMVEGSLRRLRSDYLDLYQLHSPPADVLERGEFVPTLERLQQQGKILYWGIACEYPDDVLAGLRYSATSSIQVSLSLLHPEALTAAIPRAADHGAGVIARQVFASGLLARPVDSEMKDPRRAQILEYQHLAKQRGCSLPEMALGYALGQPGVSVALVGMHRSSHLEAILQYLAKLT